MQIKRFITPVLLPLSNYENFVLSGVGMKKLHGTTKGGRETKFPETLNFLGTRMSPTLQ
jgi:hypothetical protein